MTTAQIAVVIALLWMIICLLVDKIPYSAIALGIPLIIIVGGVYDNPLDAMKNFSSGTFLLIVSIMILCNGIFKSGLAEAIGKLMLKLTGGRTSETAIFAVIIVISTALTMFLPNGGTMTIMMPIVIAVSVASGISRSKTLFVCMLAIGMGGNITQLGTVINTYCIGMINDGGYASLGFFAPALVAGPAFIIGIIYLMTIGRRHLPNHVVEDASNAAGHEIVEEELTPQQIARKKRNMVIAGIAFFMVVAGVFIENSALKIPAWIFGTFGVVLMVGTKCITEKEAFTLPWGIVCFVFACQCMASAVSASGIANLFVEPMQTVFGSNPSPILLTACLFFLGAFFTQFMSNFGTFGVFSPVALTLATAVGANPAAMLMALAMGCNASYITPMATTCNLFILGDSQAKLSDYVKTGLPQVLILFVCSIVILPMVFPFY